MQAQIASGGLSGIYVDMLTFYFTYSLKMHPALERLVFYVWHLLKPMHCLTMFPQMMCVHTGRGVLTVGEKAGARSGVRTLIPGTFLVDSCVKLFLRDVQAHVDSAGAQENGHARGLWCFSCKFLHTVVFVKCPRVFKCSSCNGSKTNVRGLEKHAENMQ